MKPFLVLIAFTTLTPLAAAQQQPAGGQGAHSPAKPSTKPPVAGGVPKPQAVPESKPMEPPAAGAASKPQAAPESGSEFKPAPAQDDSHDH